MKKQAVLYALAVLAIAAGVTGFTAKGANDKALARVDGACRRIAPLEGTKLDQMRKASGEFLSEEDAPAIARVIDAASHTRVCAELKGELEAQPWNYGRTWAGPAPDPGLPTSEEIRAILARSRPRCEAKVKTLLEALAAMAAEPISDEQREAMMAMCAFDQLAESMAPEVKEQPKALTILEEWPTRLERYAAALERGAAQEPPAAP